VSYIGSAAFLFGLRPRPAKPRSDPPSTPVAATAPVAPTAPAARSGLRHEMAEGLRFYRRSRILVASSVAVLTLNFASNIGGSIFLVFVVRELGLRPEAVGIAFSLAALGTRIGATAAQALGRRLGVGPALLAVTILGTGTQLLYVVATPDTVFGLIVAIGFAQGISFMTFNVLGVSVRQSLTPDELQGRVNATGRWLNWSAIPLGTVIGGILGSVIGLRETILVGALIGLLAIPPLALAPIRTLREMPAPLSSTP
jgi:Na+/melibiose symporter-like transporter